MDKSQLEGLSQDVVNIYNQIEQEMLVNISKELSSNLDILKTDPVAWKIKQMENMGMLNKANLDIIKKNLNITSAQLNKILYTVGMDGLKETDDAMQKAIKDGAKLKVPKPISENPQILTILKHYQQQAANIFNLTNQTMLKQSSRIYTEIINKTAADVQSGFKTVDQSIRQTIAQWAEYGIPALIDKAGRKWGPEGYVRTVMVTTTHNVAHEMQDQRFQDYGIDLVEVSSHAGARPLCAPYQGRIYSIKGSTPKYPNLYTDTSYGQPAGLFGINCGHFKYPFVEGVSTQSYFPYKEKENGQVYKESQVQRAIERSIRKAKTRYEMYKAAGDKDGMNIATNLIKSRQQRMRDFIDQTGRTRRMAREQIVKVNGNVKPIPADKTGLMPDAGRYKAPGNTPQTAASLPTHQVGDTVQFKHYTGSIKTGQITKVHTSGNYQITEQTGDKWNVKPQNITGKVEPTQPAQTKTTAQYNVGDKISFTDPFGEKNTGHITKINPNGTYVVDDGDFVHVIDPSNVHGLHQEPPSKVGNDVSFHYNGKSYDGQILKDNGSEYFVKVKGGMIKKVPKDVIDNPQPIVTPPITPVTTKPVYNIGDKVKVKDEHTPNTLGVKQAASTASVGPTGPVKKLEDIEKGDKILFNDPKTGKEVKGVVKNKFVSGKYTVYDENNVGYKIEKHDIITHVPDAIGNTIPDVKDMSSYKDVNDSSPDVKKNADIFKQMPNRDMRIVKTYTSNYYSTMNSWLRFGRKNTSKDIEAECNHLIQVLKDNAPPLTENTLTHRMFSSDALRHMFPDSVSNALNNAVYGDKQQQEYAKSMVLGGAIHDKAFVSSTYKKGSFGSGMDVAMEIYNPVGFRGGMFVDSISEYRGEKEFLYNAGTKFNIFDVSFKNGKIIFKVTPESTV